MKRLNTVRSINPVILFTGSTLLIYSFWALFSRESFSQWGIGSKVEIGQIVPIMLITMVGFTIGGLTGKHSLGGYRYVPYSFNRILTVIRVSTVLSVFSMIVILILILKSRGINGIFAAARGHHVFDYIPGVTSYIDLSQCNIAIIYILYLIRGRRVFTYPIIKWALFIAIMISLFRAFFLAERTSLFIPILACGFIYLMVKRPPLIRFICLVIAGVLFVIGAFAGTEYWRSFKAKRDYSGLNMEFTTYAMERFSVYYAASVNTGGALMMLHLEDDGYQMLFSGTFGPLATVINKVHPNGGIFLGKPMSDQHYLIRKLNYYNPEFNNSWGLASPYMEGRIWGFLYWIFIGFICCRYYWIARGAKLDPLAMCIWALLSVAILDCNRVNVFAGTSYLIPVFILLFANRWVRSN